MTETEAKVVAAWQQAALDLGIKFTSPFSITLEDGRRVEFPGFVHNFGRPVGTLIAVIGEPSGRIELRDNPNLFQSILGVGYGRYIRKSFIDTLDDWQFFGPEAERPIWYTGKCWS